MIKPIYTRLAAINFDLQYLNTHVYVTSSRHSRKNIKWPSICSFSDTVTLTLK